MFGFYFLNMDNTFRLSYDACTLIGDYCSHNKIILNEELIKTWLLGEDLYDREFKDLVIETDKVIDSEKVLVLNKLQEHWNYFISYDGRYYSMGKYVNGRIINYVPKERRLKISKSEFHGF